MLHICSTCSSATIVSGRSEPSAVVAHHFSQRVVWFLLFSKSPALKYLCRIMHAVLTCRGTIPDGSRWRPILPSATWFSAESNSISGTIPEGFRYSGIFQAARSTKISNVTTQHSNYAIYLRANKLTGTIPSFFFDAMDNPSISLTIDLGVRAQIAD